MTDPVLGLLTRAGVGLGWGSGGERQRGVREPAASLAAEAGIAVFRVAFQRWVDETNQRDLPQLIRDSLDELKALTDAPADKPLADTRNRRVRHVTGGPRPTR